MSVGRKSFLLEARMCSYHLTFWKQNICEFNSSVRLIPAGKWDRVVSPPTWHFDWGISDSVYEEEISLRF